MALVRNFKASTNTPNQVALTWDMPLNFNANSDELIITKSPTHAPMELFNTAFPTKATDSRPIEIYRGATIIGTSLTNISVNGNTLTDTGATFPVSPNLTGRLLRDANSIVYKIVSNTTTSITVDTDDTITNGKYIVLPDFPTTSRNRENYEVDLRTEVGPGFIKNLVFIQNNQLLVKSFIAGELANLIFVDGNGSRFLIKNNTESTLSFFETTTPVLGVGMAILESFFESSPTPYIDNFITESEAETRNGSGLLDDIWYYYTCFTKPKDANVAQAEFSTIDSGTSTQTYAISTKNENLGQYLYSLWPEIYKSLDTTEDLQDLMEVFGWQFNELYSLIKTYNLQDSDKVVITALLPLSEQTGLPSVGFSIGADTLRRIARDMISCWRLKGSKEGIALFIRKITTWDITEETANYSEAIQDTLPNVAAFRFFDANLGSANTRFTESDPFITGGRFARSLPGIIIPGFFSFREFVITIPNVALYTGTSSNYSVSSNTTTVEDSLINFGTNNSLVGNFLLANQEEVDDIFQIISNTANTLTVRGIITNRTIGNKYAILSPLNTNRFFILNKLMPFYIPFKSKQAYDFV